MKIARVTFAALLVCMLMLGMPVGAGGMPGCMDSAGAMTAAQVAVDVAVDSGDCDDAGKAPLRTIAICHGALCAAPILLTEMHQPFPRPALAFDAPQGLLLWRDHRDAPEPRPPSIFLAI
jgi:hypothetical protein